MWESVTVQITDRVSIMLNEAVSYGGGVYVDANCVLNVSGMVVISRNRVTRDSGGGVFAWVSSVVEVGGAITISHNSAAGEAGGAYVDLNSTLIVADGAVLKNNSATGNAGCILHARGARANISGKLHGCSTRVQGGAIFAYQDAHVLQVGHILLTTRLAQVAGMLQH